MSFYDDEEIEIRFSPNQKLPEGYAVVWSRATEHYHAINRADDWDSDIYSNRFDARAVAIRRAKKQHKEGQP